MAGFEEESFQSGASNPAEDRGSLFMTSVLTSSCQALYFSNDTLCGSGTGNIFIFYKNCLYKIVFILFLLSFTSF